MPEKKTNNVVKLWQILGYMGLLPFFTCMVISLFIPELQLVAKQSFIYYSAIILSFIAGSLWRIDQKTKRGKTQIISNLFSLIACFTLLTDFWLALWILATSYLFIFLFERSIRHDKALNRQYMSMRFWLTSVVVLLHMIAIIFWF
ncbi:DUF3429 domain-containing protein [Thalassotalea atypica]|uniref:DUF3429 domain-containing protein n=1 Tax=Thalassotalea atypica TaxID=2054316 RepID=UPI0025731F9F|nr:DUF3429 domain-containing protein [Thalassotalea atypica]